MERDDLATYDLHVMSHSKQSQTDLYYYILSYMDTLSC